MDGVEWYQSNDKSILSSPLVKSRIMSQSDKPSSGQTQICLPLPLPQANHFLMRLSAYHCLPRLLIHHFHRFQLQKVVRTSFPYIVSFPVPAITFSMTSPSSGTSAIRRFPFFPYMLDKAATLYHPVPNQYIDRVYPF